MRRENKTLSYLVALVLLAAVCAGLMNANLRFARANPGGNDFVPRWVGARAALFDRASPYSEAVNAEIQQRIYGRPAQAGEDPQLFVYPYYSVIVFAPFALIEDFEVARAAWMTALELSLMVIAFLSLRMAGWKPRLPLLAVYLVFSLLGYLAVRGVVNGNPAVVAALFITLALYCVQRRADEWGGIWLALAAIKPQMMILLLVFTLIWALARRRVRIVTAFALAIGVLIGGSFLLEPSWLVDNLRQVTQYPGYTLPGTPLAIFSEWWGRPGEWLAWALTGLLALLLMREWGVAAGRDADLYLWTAAVTLTATFLVGIPNPSANQVTLLPVFPLLFSLWAERWPRLAGWLAAATLAGVGLGLWALFLATLERAGQPLEHLSLHFPLPVFLLLALYWMRWWVQRANRRLPAEKVKILSRL